jgi:Raf kinase inhibitor-like YbhB/YbcL family protein
LSRRSETDGLFSSYDLDCRDRKGNNGRVSMSRGGLITALLFFALLPAFAGGNSERHGGIADRDTGSKDGPEVSHMTISSTAFQDSNSIPVEYTCKGQDVSPTLRFDGVPASARSLALIVEDPDAPAGLWVHWVVYNIPPARGGFERAVSRTERLSDGTIQGVGSNGRIGYAGPCPPSGTHRYFFRLYALDSSLTLRPGASRDQLLSTMKGHVIGQATLMGTVSK